MATQATQTDRVVQASLDAKGRVAQTDVEYLEGKEASAEEERRAVNAKANKESDQLHAIREYVQEAGGPGAVVAPTVPSDPKDTRTAVDVMSEVSGEPGQEPGPADVPPAPPAPQE